MPQRRRKWEGPAILVTERLLADARCDGKWSDEETVTALRDFIASRADTDRRLLESLADFLDERLKEERELDA